MEETKRFGTWKNRSVMEEAKCLSKFQKSSRESRDTHSQFDSRKGKISEEIKDVAELLEDFVSIPYLFYQILHSNSTCTTQPPALCS